MWTKVGSYGPPSTHVSSWIGFNFYILLLVDDLQIPSVWWAKKYTMTLNYVRERNKKENR